jgi:ribosomal protein S11
MLKKKVYKYKSRKRHFFFGKKKIGKLYIRRTFTNIFLTLTDLKNKVVICKTSGTSNISENKRRKRIPIAVEKIMVFIYFYIKLYKITSLHIVLKMRLKGHARNLFKRLNYYNINVLTIKSKRKIAHNGVRGRKLRRL